MKRLMLARSMRSWPGSHTGLGMVFSCSLACVIDRWIGRVSISQRVRRQLYKKYRCDARISLDGTHASLHKIRTCRRPAGEGKSRERCSGTAARSEPTLADTYACRAGRSRSARSIIQFEFTGDAKEFFRIWIVNLALSIVTLGIYSAWAKVRTQPLFLREHAGGRRAVRVSRQAHSDSERTADRVRAVRLYVISGHISFKMQLRLACS